MENKLCEQMIHENGRISLEAKLTALITEWFDSLDNVYVSHWSEGRTTVDGDIDIRDLAQFLANNYGDKPETSKICP
jgi:hypothetical protein